MTCYVDIYTNPPNDEAFERILVEAEKLGYCKVGAPYNLKPRGARRVEHLPLFLVEASTRREVARALARIPVKGRAIVLVKPQGLDAARYACVNKRVAGLLLEPGGERFVDRSTANLFRERGWGIVVVPLTYIAEAPRSRRIWRFYYLALRKAYAYGISVALASGASSEWGLWHPYSAAGVAELFGIPGDYARLWLSSSPASLLSALGYS